MSNAVEVLAAWEKNEQQVPERIRNGSARVGLVTPEQVAGKSGMKIFAGMLGGKLSFASKADTLDFFLAEVENGCSVLP